MRWAWACQTKLSMKKGTWTRREANCLCLLMYCIKLSNWQSSKQLQLTNEQTATEYRVLLNGNLLQQSCMLGSVFPQIEYSKEKRNEHSSGFDKEFACSCWIGFLFWLWNFLQCVFLLPTD